MDLQHPVWGVKLFHYGTDKCAFAFRMHHVLSDGQGILLAISNWSAGFNGSGKAVKRAPNPLFDKPPPAPLPPSREEWSSYIKQFYQDVSQYGSVRKSPWFNSDEKNQNGVWHKQASTSKLIPITELRRCKAAIGCNNVNDIAVAMITGAFSRVLKAKNCELDEYFCYMIPKSYRTAQDPDLCNRIDFLHVYVPTSIESLLERSHKVSELMGKAKTKPHGDVPYRRRMSLVNVWDLRRDADAAFLRRTHAVISNIPEPPNPITFGPIKTTSYSGFGPLSSVGALFFTLVTQQGRISLSVQMDEDRGPSATEFYAAGTAKELCDAFDAEYEELGRIVSEIEKSNGVKVVRKTESEVSPGVEARL